MNPVTLFLQAFPAPLVTAVICCLVVAVCVMGDNLMNSSVITGHTHAPILKALVDSCTHGTVGGVTWAIVEATELWTGRNAQMTKVLLRCFACAVLASVIDVDHFIAAGSLKLEDAVSLPRRPPLHNTSLILAGILLCWLLRGFLPSLSMFSLMLLVAWMSHHLRDANRRGLWCPPLGSSPSLPSHVYIMLIIVLGLVSRLVYFHAFLPRSSTPDELTASVSQV